MRITVYCPHYEDAGGVQEVVRRLNRGMVGRGHVLTVVARAPGGAAAPLPAVDPVSGAPIARVRLVRAPYPALGVRAYRRFARRFPAAAIGLLRAVGAASPDVVAAHCTKFHAPYVLLMRVVLRRPIVVHLHNGPETADGPERPRLQRLLQRCADRVIAVSPPVAAYARVCVPARAERVVVIPNGSDMVEMTAASPAAPSRPYALGVGRLARQKGFDVLIDALAASEATLDLVLAGEGPEREALVARARERGLDGRLRLAGGVDRPAVAALLRGATLVAIPSRFEGFSLVCREAMAAGAPIVASNLPEFPGELRDGETGLLVPVEDAPALARAIRILTSDPERARALGRAAQAASRNFPGWDEVTERVLALYGEAVGRR